MNCHFPVDHAYVLYPEAFLCPPGQTSLSLPPCSFLLSLSSCISCLFLLFPALSLCCTENLVSGFLLLILAPSIRLRRQWEVKRLYSSCPCFSNLWGVACWPDAKFCLLGAVLAWIFSLRFHLRISPWKKRLYNMLFSSQWELHFCVILVLQFPSLPDSYPPFLILPNSSLSLICCYLWLSIFVINTHLLVTQILLIISKSLMTSGLIKSGS